MSLIIRLRSREGTSRITVSPDTTGEDLAQQIVDSLPDKVDAGTITISNTPAHGTSLSLDSLANRTVADMAFKNGEMLFVNYQTESAAPSASAPFTAPSAPLVASASSFTSQAPAAAAAFPSPSAPSIGLSKVEEEQVDQYYRTQTGMIPRERDAKMCRHGAKGMCDYCMPLEPYDAAYHAENKIKHLSFPAYLRKLTGSQSASKASTSSSAIPPLTPLDFQVKTPCPSGSHAPWPVGICSKCQPSAITLQSQEFRLVDHVEFASPALVDRFLEGWRRTGTQRLGFLLGRYEPYDGVPMGVKAVVEAVIEPQQEGEVDGVAVDLPWQDEADVRKLAAECWKGLQVVGVVYTDLTASPEDITKTLYKRHPQSYYLSSLELLFSARMQLNHPNPSKSSPTGIFGSRFVTCVLTGTEDGGIDVLAFQASEQAVAMVQADMIEASVEPSTVRVKKEGAGRYIPDVFYTFKNEYKLQVKQSAKPCFPVEYLLVNLTHGFPKSPSPLFPVSSFPIANRPKTSAAAEPTMGKVISSLLPIVGDGTYDGGPSSEQTKRQEIEHWAGDWHLLSFLQKEGGLGEEAMALLARVATAHAREGGDDEALDRLVRTDGWLTLMEFVKATREAQAQASFNSAPDDDDFPDIPPDHDFDQPGGGGGGGMGGEIICPHCTFVNDHGGDCDICGLPLAG